VQKDGGSNGYGEMEDKKHPEKERTIGRGEQAGSRPIMGIAKRGNPERKKTTHCGEKGKPSTPGRRPGNRQEKKGPTLPNWPKRNTEIVAQTRGGPMTDSRYNA